MPRPRWPHLLREVSRHGTVRWIVRIGHGPRTPIAAPYGSPEFEAAYYAAIVGDTPRRLTVRRDEASLAWIVARYQGSAAWTALAHATQRQRANIFKHVVASAGNMPYREVTRTKIMEGRERRAATPSQANNWLNAMRALFRWAIEQEFLDKDPTENVKIVKRPKSGGFREAIEEDINRFEARWPLGTRERLALTIFVETGLRRGDAARVGRQHVKGGKIIIRTEKTGQIVRIPVSDALAATIDATSSTGLTFIAKADGSGMTKESLGNWFREACVAAGVEFSAHGLRKAAAARLTDLGLTEAELEQVMGWAPGSGMARIYTRRRDSAVLADRVADKMRTAYSQPKRKVGNDD